MTDSKRKKHNSKYIQCSLILHMGLMGDLQDSHMEVRYNDVYYPVKTCLITSNYTAEEVDLNLENYQYFIQRLNSIPLGRALNDKECFPQQCIHICNYTVHKFLTQEALTHCHEQWSLDNGYILLALSRFIFLDGA